MNSVGLLRRGSALAASVMIAVSGCSFRGVNSLPLPGTVGRGPGAALYHLKFADVGTLEPNSPVMIDDVVVGTVTNMTVDGWEADVEVSVKPDVTVPANAVATVGQTSLLGSMHVALDPPAGQAPTGRLAPGTTLALRGSSTYPSTEQTLSSLSVVVNGGGLGQIGDIIHNLNLAFTGRQDQIRDLISRLDKIIGIFADQRDEIIESIGHLDKLAAVVSDQRDTVTQALNRVPRALDVLIKEQPRFTTALDKLRKFSDTTAGVVNTAHGDLVTNLRNLEPTLRALADVGPDLGPVLAFLPSYPYPQDFIDRGIKGDYVNYYAIVDFTIPRLKRSLLLGTRWGRPGTPLVPLPGEPDYLNYTYTDQPLAVGVNRPPGAPSLVGPMPPAPAASASPGAAVPEPAPGAPAPPPPNASLDVPGQDGH
jgi:virulence factor Mce-like protein